jgi:hypothetical protein
MAACLTGPGGVQLLSDTEYDVGAPISDSVRIVETEAPERLKLESSQGSAVLQLSETAPAMTRLAYRIEGSGDEARTRAQVDLFLERLAAEISNPPERAADGLLMAGAANLPAPRLPAMVGGLPTVFWLGAIVFLLILGSIASAYI